MGIEPTTLRTLVGCSSHWARLLLSGKSAHENTVTVQVVPRRRYRCWNQSCMEGPFLLEDLHWIKRQSLAKLSNIHILMHLKKSLLTSLLNNFLGNIRQRQRRCKNRRPNWIKHRPHFASEGIYRSSCWTSERFKSSEWCHINWTWHHPWSLGLRWSTSLLCVVPSFFIDTSSLYVGVWSQQRIKGNCSAMFPTRNFETSSH